ncbi:class I SAM-dependent methyltransferase [Nannocystis sp. ILAH1]|nr:class I SAM-dependent methyltransferase [Nannocystis sp. ILAH1]MCY0987164.1 class I SAM-dependent methyltransferase [Nannocystis sp. ILAH1]
MHPILKKAFLAVTFGGACTPSARVAVPSGHDGPGHGRHHGPGAHHGFTNADTWAEVFDSHDREAWQRPEEVLRALALEPTMRVADVGAGTGYFAVRLARAVPAGEVIATDIEPDMVRYLNERARREKLANLRSVQSTGTGSGLAAASVDRILVVHVWHHLDDRERHARELAAALRPGGKLMIVDFSMAGHRGPPAHMRVPPEVVVAELASAGLSARVLPLALPDQYIVEGRREP